MASYAPDPDLKFTFGLWTVGNVGRDPFGGPVREPLSVGQLCDLLGEVGAYGVNFHDNDLVPIDATPADAERIKSEFKQGPEGQRPRRPDGDHQPLLRPGLQGRRLHQQQRARPRLRPPEDHAGDGTRGRVRRQDLRLLGRPRGRRVRRHQVPRRGHQAVPRGHQLPVRVHIDQGYGYKFAFEAKPNEPRGHIYFAVTGSYLALIPTLDHPEMCGVNPEVAHEHMAGLNFVHQVAAALEQNKLFHIDLNDQEFGRYDQDFRFGSVNLKHAFFLVKLLEDHSYNGPRQFDAHAFRQSDYDDVKEFARGCMRTYMILKEKAGQVERRQGNPGPAPDDQPGRRDVPGPDEEVQQGERQEAPGRPPGSHRAGGRAAAVRETGPTHDGSADGRAVIPRRAGVLRTLHFAAAYSLTTAPLKHV